MKATTQPIPVPAPNGGVNRIDSLTAMPENDAIFMYNMIPSEFGNRARTGYTEYATGVGTEVRTILPFTGSQTSKDKLFGMSSAGIYDLSLSVVSPATIVAFGINGADAGYGQWTNFTTIATGNFALYTDESNGYYSYTESTDTWLKVTMGGGANQISGIDPANLVGVVIFKNRPWFIEKNSASAWYLGSDALYGAATEFNFGNKFKHGGTLAALFNWTVDGGEGVDDYLVAIGSGGDVILYKGTDPASATTFAQQGAWFIGVPPVGRRIGGNFGGELYILSVYGLLPLTKLISGALIQQDDIYLSKKVTPLVKAEMNTTRSVHGWEVKLVPSENLLLVSSPKRDGIPYQQFVYSLNTPGWSVYRDLPYLTGDAWQGNFYFSDSTGRVFIHQGDLDNVSLSGSTFSLINWSFLMPFKGYGADGYYHRIQFIRAIFLAAQAPSYSTEARYDYNLSETLPAPASSIVSGAVWDTALWDVGLWTGDFTEVEGVRGGSSMGRVMSIGLSGSSGFRTIFVKFDLLADQATNGGML